MAREIVAIKEVVKRKRVKFFIVEDDVILFLRNERSPVGTYGKSQPCQYGQFKVTRKINDNDYVVALRIP